MLVITAASPFVITVYQHTHVCGLCVSVRVTVSQEFVCVCMYTNHTLVYRKLKCLVNILPIYN